MATLKSLTIYESLRARILSGALPAGSRLIARHLARHHGVSDIPVREALRMLERDGLIEIIPYRGARVVTLSPAEVEEGYLIRGHLESLATRSAVGHLTDEHFQDLERCMHSMAEALEHDDHVRYAELNREFHGTIFSACPYRRLQELIDNLWDGQTGYQMVFRLSPAWLRHSYEEHAQILQALRAEDAEAAATIALQHKLAVSRALVEAVNEAKVRREATG